MPFASTISYLPKDQSLKFLQKILRIGGLEKLSFFELEIFLNNLFYFILLQISQSILGSKHFDDAPGFQQKTTPAHMQYSVGT